MSWKPLPSRWTLHSAKKKKPMESRLSQIQSLRLRFHGDAAADARRSTIPEFAHIAEALVEGNIPISNHFYFLTSCGLVRFGDLAGAERGKVERALLRCGVQSAIVRRELALKIVGGIHEITLLDGAHYKGTLRNGKPHGLGTMTSLQQRDRRPSTVQSKTHLQQNNRPSTAPSMADSSAADLGWTHVGLFVQGRREGRGSTKWTSGDTYEGEWLNDMMEGHGKYVWASGDCYEGMWVAGSRSGRGAQQSVNGATYDGEWVDGKWEGAGTRRYATGDLYIGQFAGNMRHGSGLMKWQDGHRFEGGWENGMRSGFGTCCFIFFFSNCMTEFLSKYYDI